MMTDREQILLWGLVAAVGAWALRNREELEEIVVNAQRRSSIAVGDVADRVGDLFTPRGIRNNNPGNIRLTNIAWQGKVSPTLNTDGAFEQFVSPLFGIRAIARDLKTDFSQGLRTLADLIAEWAPPNENNTAAYIASVAKRTGIDPGAPINLDVELVPVVTAIIWHENGQQPYDDAVIREAVARA